MNAARTIGLLAGVWVILMGIAWLVEAFPDAPPEHTRGSAADYGSVPDEPDEPDDDGPGFTRGSAADYGDPTDPTPAGSPIAPAPPTAPPTYDGPWTETTDCEDLADVRAIREETAAAGKRSTLMRLAEARYPPGVRFIEAMNDEALDTFAPGSSFDELVSAFDTVVHEGSHMWSARQMRLARRTYSLLPDDDRNLHRFPTFDRARITEQMIGPPNDTYRRIYLEGESGAQGLETLLDETNAYVHSLASATCIHDLFPAGRSRSSRDGILAMLLYLGEYLRLARVEEPEIYQRIRGDQAYVRFIVDQWERAHYWLAKSAPYGHLGIYDAAFSDLVHANRIRSEFEMIRRALAP